VRVELTPQGVDQRAVLIVDRAPASEALVVARDVLEPLARDVATTRDVLEERHDVVHAFGPAESDDENGIEERLRIAADCAVGRRLWLLEHAPHPVPSLATARPAHRHLGRNDGGIDYEGVAPAATRIAVTMLS
jgi:hypothetical protein